MNNIVYVHEINKQVCSNYATGMTRVPLSFDLINKYVLCTDIYERIRVRRYTYILYILITRSLFSNTSIINRCAVVCVYKIWFVYFNCTVYVMLMLSISVSGVGSVGWLRQTSVAVMLLAAKTTSHMNISYFPVVWQASKIVYTHLYSYIY